jgi:1-acyl-sn-glycerol-3-phosphate acyltransferase
VRVLKTHALPNSFSELPVAVFANHASWWDPLVCLLLAAEYFPGRASFAPIDARALQRYRLLERFGFFPVEVRSARGAAAFVQNASTILESPKRILWLTPQGKFTDVRERPVSFQRGLAHLAGRVGPSVFLPIALEYTFWEERTPEVLLAFGTPLFTNITRIAAAQTTGAALWNERCKTRRMPSLPLRSDELRRNGTLCFAAPRGRQCSMTRGGESALLSAARSSNRSTRSCDCA